MTANDRHEPPRLCEGYHLPIGGTWRDPEKEQWYAMIEADDARYVAHGPYATHAEASRVMLGLVQARLGGAR